MLGRRKPEEAPPPPGPPPRTTPTMVRVGPAPVQHKSLGELLIDEGLITSEQLNQALETQKAQGGFLGQLLVQLGHVTQEAVASCLVKQCKIPHLSLLDYDIGRDVLALVPEEVCRRYNLLPIDKLGSILTVAMVDPLDLQALEAVRQVCPDLRIKPILCNWQHFELVAGKIFTKKGEGGHTEITAKSLGLSDPAPIVEVPPVPVRPSAPAAAPPAAQSTPPSQAPAATPGVSSQELALVLRESLREAMGGVISEMAAQRESGGGGLSTGDLAAAMRQSMQEMTATLVQELRTQPVDAQGAGVPAEAMAAVLRDAVREAVSQLAQTRGSDHAAPLPVPAGPSAQELAQMIHDGVGGAIQEAMATLAVQMRAASAAERPAAPDLHEFAAVIRDSVGAAMQEAMATMVVQMKASSGAEPVPAGPDLHDFAAAIRDSVGGAMQEAMATMLVQMRASQGKKEDSLSPEQLAQVLRQSVGEAIAAAQAQQGDQGTRLAEIAEAALQSVQQASLLVESASGGLRERQAERAHLREKLAPIAPFPSAKARPSGGMLVNPEAVEQADARVRESLDADRPQEALSFESFFPGNANAFTYKLGQAVAASPGGEYNPFFLFGNVGVGKTHLINAIGNAICEQRADLRVGYVSASHFSRKLSEAVKQDATEAFREGYCHWDVLILDDIQFLAGRVEAQEEFFHIFNVLHQAGRQIIIASDKAPDRLGLLEKRLVSRFGSGIVAELKAPEWETRMEILRHAAAQSGLAVPDEILSLVAMRVNNDIRRMVGSLRKILAFAKLVGQDLSCEMADEILSHLKVEAAA